MASELRVNTLKDASGNNSIGLSYVAEGTAKVVCTFNGAASGATIRTSFNVSSTDDDDTGQYGVNFTSAMSGTEFTPIASNIGDSTTSERVSGFVSAFAANTATSINISAVEADGGTAYKDWTHINTIVHGDLA